jgi:hypothetical protein
MGIHDCPAKHIAKGNKYRILTLSIVVLDTGTNFPAVRVNSLLAMAVMKMRQRWKETGIPTQSHLHAASLTLSACNILSLCPESNSIICVYVIKFG